MSWNALISALHGFKLTSAPVNERGIEASLRLFLAKNSCFNVEEQRISRLGRNDLWVISQGDRKKYCIELKVDADASCFGQLDRYSVEADGVVLVCWKASEKVRRVFELAQRSAKIPIELVEIRSHCKMV